MNSLSAPAMAFSAWQTSFLRPSAITIHNYCDVTGHLLSR
jgi:hypothetical protein